VSLSRGDNDAAVLQVVVERQAEHGGRCWFEGVEELVLETVKMRMRKSRPSIGSRVPS
jgi:hypothetical protein